MLSDGTGIGYRLQSIAAADGAVTFSVSVPSLYSLTGMFDR